MSYATLLESERVNPQMLVVVRPYASMITGWTVFSGSVYRKAQTDQVISCSDSDGTLTVNTTTSLSAGQYYHDIENGYLYVRTSSGSSPAVKDFVAEIELYFGTYDAHWHRNPVDTSTRVVYYEPLVITTPSVFKGGQDASFGVFPTRSNTVSFSNLTHYFEPYLYAYSFNQAKIDLYHWLDSTGVGELAYNNIKKIFTGFCSNVTVTDGYVSIMILDSSDLFNNEWRNPTGDNFFTLTTFPNLDPVASGYPIRYVYGRVDGHVPINIDYVSKNYTTSDNRDWIVCNGTIATSPSVSTTVTGVSSTTTRTYVVSVAGLDVGDSVYMDHIGPGHQHGVTITAINRVSNYFDHAAIHSAMNSGDTVIRGFIGSVTIVQNNITYDAQYGRDYTVGNFSGTSIGFSFTTSLESNLGMASTLSPNDRVVCRVYGKTNAITLSGGGFGANDTEISNLTNPVVILFDVLKQIFSESELALTSFSTLESTRTDALGLVFPEFKSYKFPTFKDIISEICKTCLLKIYQDDDLKWAVSAIGPMASNTYSVTDDKILLDSYNYSFDYTRIYSDVLVSYDRNEVSLGTDSSQSHSRTLATSTVASRLHRVNKQYDFKCSYFRLADAETLASRLRYIYGDRLGTIQISSKNNLFSAEINGVLEIERQSIPGFSYVQGTNQTLDSVIVSIDKSLNSVKLVLDDQKGIEDNEASW